jgi:dolichyl-phosphate-mannose--protein O-mannosyl transferase
MRSAVARAALAVGAVTLVAGVLRLHGLSHPSRKVFDEVYYASDGCLYAGHPFRQCGLEVDSERSWVHPPLGKQLIALGIDMFGNRALGWRLSAAVAGTAAVALVGVLAFLLFGSALWSGAAALLAAAEHLQFVQSRMAMLDIFVALFVVLGFVLLVADRRRADRILAARGDPPGDEAEVRTRSRRLRGWRPLRLAAGAAFGAATAVKWSGGLALVGALILAVAWERTRRKEAGLDRPTTRALLDEAPGLAFSMLLVPLLVYSATWVPWLADRGFSLLEWVGHHGGMAEYHLGLETTKENGEPIHPYMSRAWTWLLLARPVAYYWQGDPRCCGHILGIGNQLLFWGALAVLPYLAVSWAARRDWRAGAILVPVLVQYLPWLLVSRPLFLFYMTPVTPFLAVGMTYLLRDLGALRLPERRYAIPAVLVVVAVGVGLFVFFWPVLTGDRISYEAWRHRMWFGGWI